VGKEEKGEKERESTSNSFAIVKGLYRNGGEKKKKKQRQELLAASDCEKQREGSKTRKEKGRKKGTHKIVSGTEGEPKLSRHDLELQ